MLSDGSKDAESSIAWRTWKYLENLKNIGHHEQGLSGQKTFPGQVSQIPSDKWVNRS